MTSLSFIETRESKGKVRLECLEAWGGNERVNRAVELPGLAGWIYSDPIGKTGGNLFLDRLERLLRERFHVANVVRTAKPTFAKAAPPGIMKQLRTVDAVVEALAD